MTETMPQGAPGMSRFARIALIAALAATGAAGIGHRHLARTAEAQEAAAAPARPEIGATPSANQLQMIEDPGRFGIGPAPRGTHYAVHRGHLIRLNETGKIVSILRPLPDSPRPSRR